MFLIPFSLVLLWNNEKKVVTFAELIVQDRKAVMTVSAEEPDDANDFKLVHMTGVAVPKETITDKDFGIEVENSYRLKRKVEMY